MLFTHMYTDKCNSIATLSVFIATAWTKWQHNYTTKMRLSSIQAISTAVLWTLTSFLMPAVQNKVKLLALQLLNFTLQLALLPLSSAY